MRKATIHIVSIVFSSTFSAFSYNFYYIMSAIIFKLYHNVLICTYQGIISWFMLNNFVYGRIWCNNRYSFERFTQVG